MMQRSDDEQAVLGEVVSKTGIRYMFIHGTWTGDDGRVRQSLRVRVGRDVRWREVGLPQWTIEALLDAVDKFRERTE